jgi:hypothetical protein
LIEEEVLAVSLRELEAPRSAGPDSLERGLRPSTDVVSLSRRRGLEQVPDAWSGPPAIGEGYRDRAEPVILGRGTLSDVEAMLLLMPRKVPQLWALDDLVASVSGDLGQAELVRVAESPRPRT